MNRIDPNGRLAVIENTVLVTTVVAIASGVLYGIEEGITCILAKTFDQLQVELIRIALDTGGDFTPEMDNGVQQASSSSEKCLPWKCLIRCYINEDGATIPKRFWFLGEAMDVDEACRKAEDSNRQLLNDIPGVAVKHCDKDPGGTRITWRRPQDAPRIKNGQPVPRR